MIPSPWNLWLACADPEPTHASVPPRAPSVPIALHGGGVATEGAAFSAVDAENAGWLVGRPDGTLVHALLPEGAHPFRTVLDGDVAWATLRDGGLARWDLDTPSPEVVDTCSGPRGIDRFEGGVIVACVDGMVVLHGPSGAILEQHEVGSDLRDVVVEGDTVWFSRFLDAQIVATRASNLRILTETSPQDAAVDPKEGFEPSVAWRMVAHPLGGVAMLHQMDTIASVLQEDWSAERTPSGPGIAACNAMLHQRITHARLDPATGALVVRTSGPLGDAVVAQDLAFDGAGRVIVSVTGVRDGASPADLLSFDQELEASEACVEPLERWPGAEAVGIAMLGDGRPVVVDHPFRVRVDGSVVHDSGRARGSGQDAFHRPPAHGSMACASCHPEGGDNGHLWPIAYYRPTRAMRVAGRLEDRNPYHWDGSLESMTALLDQLSVHLGGTVGSGVARFAEGLQPVRLRPEGSEPEGEALFQSSGCTLCHSGPAYTTNEILFDGSFETKVPSLLGVGYGRAWMSSACADTLKDRFDDPCADEDHLVTSAADRKLLARFLETL